MKKNIMMIGGSKGIGQTIAHLTHNDYKVYVASRTAEGMEDLSVTHLPFDALTDRLDFEKLPETLHGFVYCPGSINLKPIKVMGLDTFREDMELNFFGLVNVVKQVLPKMAENASMVFFSTVAVGSGMPFHTSIAAAKGAIEGFAKALAAEYAPKIRVNVIAPSLVDTALSGRLLNNEKKRELMAQRHPLKKFGTPEDIAHMAVFLLGDKSAWITGQVIGIDGGLSSLKMD